ncbi:SDR family NAD(P)-dependent oxidoreductase [Sphingosinicellaceae bacterium]|nr:SDR family NAD(P)-dependent oxidoreductase [Sphingosinicellaceae bacterium]
MQLKPLHDQVVVITGASSGIGLATAEAASARGARLVLVARNGDALAEIAARLNAQGGQVEVVVADIADDSTPERIADAALARFGRVDSWVNNAAAATYGTLAETPEEDHRRVFDVGYFGTVRASLRALEVLKERGGALVNVGSILANRAMMLQGPYSAMKHALKGFTDALRSEVLEARLPVSITLIKPGSMATPYPEHARNRMERPARIPPIEYDPRLVARAILFCLEHPRREITVGGVGRFIELFGNAFPGLTDLGIALIGRGSQQIDQPPAPEVADNLYEHRADGRIETVQDVYVRRTSLALEAQIRPLQAVAAVGAGLLAAALLASPRRR